MKILIADDSRTDVALISGILSAYETLTAYDGVEALECIREHPDIDMLILDISMPRMNGFEVLEALQADSESSDIATLILTNSDEIDNEMRGLDLGAVDYIRKPLNIRSLRKRVELHVKLKNARKELSQQNSILEKTVRERTRESVLTRDVTIHAMIGLLEVRNIESSNHTKRTQLMMRALCNHLRAQEPFNTILTDAYSTELFDTTPLHDIGKVGIPDHIFRDGAKTYPGHTGSAIDQPAKTLKAGDHGVPGGENMIRYPDGAVRYLTTYEAKLLQTFPDDFIVAGSWGESMRQIGNAVPVKLSAIIAKKLIHTLQAKQADT